jgi:hypothetical protein
MFSRALRKKIKLKTKTFKKTFVSQSAEDKTKSFKLPK